MQSIKTFGVHVARTTSNSFNSVAANSGTNRQEKMDFVGLNYGLISNFNGISQLKETCDQTALR